MDKRLKVNIWNVTVQGYIKDPFVFVVHSHSRSKNDTGFNHIGKKSLWGSCDLNFSQVFAMDQPWYFLYNFDPRRGKRVITRTVFAYKFGSFSLHFKPPIYWLRFHKCHIWSIAGISVDSNTKGISNIFWNTVFQWYGFISKFQHGILISTFQGHPSLIVLICNLRSLEKLVFYVGKASSLIVNFLILAYLQILVIWS